MPLHPNCESYLNKPPQPAGNQHHQNPTTRRLKLGDSGCQNRPVFLPPTLTPLTAAKPDASRENHRCYIQHRVKKLTPSQKPNESSTLPGQKSRFCTKQYKTCSLLFHATSRKLTQGVIDFTTHFLRNRSGPPDQVNLADTGTIPGKELGSRFS